MVAIVADDPKIEREIQSLFDILVGAGCGFHSNLVIHEKGGELSLKTAEPMEFGKEIIRLPRTVLMPSDQYALDIKDGAFVVSYPDMSIATDLQRRIIDKMYEIYNVTNKIKLHEEYSFLLSLKNSPGLIEKLGGGREFIVGPYHEWLSWIKAGMTDQQHRKITYETYVKTRPLGYSDPIRESSVSMIMPVLDFMNHHWGGGAFSVGQGGLRKGDLVMHSSQPFEGSTECYASYGILDSFDTLVRYDFIDELAPILRSVPIDLEGPAGDKIEIRAKIGFTYSQDLDPEMQDLRRHIPDISFKNGQMIVSHILLPLDGSIFALVRVLNLVLAAYNKFHSMTMTQEERKAWRLAAQHAIVEKNRAYYKDVLGFIETLSPDQRQSFGVERVRRLLSLQQTNIEKYKIQE